MPSETSPPTSQFSSSSPDVVSPPIQGIFGPVSGPLISAYAPTNDFMKGFSDTLKYDLDSDVEVVHVVAEGSSIDKLTHPFSHCGVPSIYAAHRRIGDKPETRKRFLGNDVESLIVWTEKKCNRRECPDCFEKGYLVKQSGDSLSHIQKNIMKLIRSGQYRAKRYGGIHRLKAFHMIVSLEKDDSVKNMEEFKLKKQRAYEIAKNHGMFWGLCIPHFYRGGSRWDRGPEKRKNLDRSHQSLHFHMVGLGYYTLNSGAYVCKKCGKRRGIRDDKNHICCDEKMKYDPLDYVIKIFTKGIVKTSRSALQKLWGILHNQISYHLDHAGYFPKSQIVTRFGSVSERNTEFDIRPPAITMLEDPEDGYLFPADVRIPNDQFFRATELMKNIVANDHQVPRSGDFVEDMRFRFYHKLELNAELDDSQGDTWDQGSISWMKYHSIKRNNIKTNFTVMVEHWRDGSELVGIWDVNKWRFSLMRDPLSTDVGDDIEGFIFEMRAYHVQEQFEQAIEELLMVDLQDLDGVGNQVGNLRRFLYENKKEQIIFPKNRFQRWINIYGANKIFTIIFPVLMDVKKWRKNLKIWRS